MANKKTKQARRKNLRRRKQRGAVYAALIARARFAGVPRHLIPIRGDTSSLIAFRRTVEKYENGYVEPTLLTAVQAVYGFNTLVTRPLDWVFKDFT